MTYANAPAPRLPVEASAVLAALQFKNADVSGLHRLTETQWKSLLRFCELAHLTLPLAQLRINELPAWVTERLENNLADNALRFERVKATYREAADTLHSAGVDHLVVKGFTQAPDFVPDARLRQQSDLDIYCQPDQITRAQAALESIGYVSDQKLNYSDSDHAPTMLRMGNWTWRGNAFDADMPLSIELHFCLWNEKTSHFSVAGVDQFWQRRITRDIDGVEASTLDPVDQLGHIGLHILRNLFTRDSVIHHVYECAFFLHHHTEDHDFWDRWKASHSDSLRAKAAIAFHLAQRWFDCDLPEAARAEIEGLPAEISGWLQHFGAASCEGVFIENRDIVWLHWALLSGPMQKLLLLRRTFLPNRVPNPKLPALVLIKKGLPAPASGNPITDFTKYFARRSASYLKASLETVRRGIAWRLSQRQLANQFLIFLAASFFFDLGFSIYFFLFNLFLLGHGFNEKTLGLITGAMAAGGFVGAIPAGKFARRHGLRAALLTTFLLAIAVSSARALFLAPPLQIGLAFLSGAALSIWAVCISPAVAQMTTPEQRPFAFSLVFSLGIGVGALGGFAGGRLPGLLRTHHVVQAVDPLRIVLLLSCAFVALGIWPVTKLVFTRSDTPSCARQAFLSPFLIRILPAIAAWGLVTGSFSPFASVYFAQHMRMSLPQIGNAFSLSQIAQVAAVLVAPLIFRRWSLAGGIVTTQLIAAILLCFLAATSTSLAATLGYAAFTAFQWMNEPGLYSLLMDRVPVDQRENAAASQSMVTSASQIVAAILAGGAFARFGYVAVMPIIAVIALFAAAMFWVAARPGSRLDPALTPQLATVKDLPR